MDNGTNSNPPEQSLQQSSSINGTSNVATDIFNTHKLTLGNNVKNLVILIPNEGHHGPQSSGQTGGALGSADTVGMVMVPTQDILTYTTNLEGNGFNIDVHITSRIQEAARAGLATNKHYLCGQPTG